MYSLNVVLTLIAMITLGAARTIAVKVYFQMELEESMPATPVFVTLLYLVGQSLALVVYYVYAQFIQNFESNNGYSAIEMSDTKLGSDDNILAYPEAIDDSDSSTGNETETLPDDENQNGDHGGSMKPPRPELKRSGSDTGLTEESKDAVAWVHRIPWYLKPMIPGFLNLCNSALRWACLIFVAASTAEILISGLELVCSSFAARIIRKRIISKRRWVGVSIISVGIILVGAARTAEKKGESEDEGREFFIGNILILGQCVFAVLQDLSEEIFTQEADFPATLLLGMEGAFGLIFGAPIYFLLSEDLSFARSSVGYEVGLVLLVLLTGIINIYTTFVTSSMTRNVWKQFRVILVWILGLAVYYTGSGDRLGEPFIWPDSFFILGGFSVVLTGVYFYY